MGGVCRDDGWRVRSGRGWGGEGGWCGCWFGVGGGGEDSFLAEAMPLSHEVFDNKSLCLQQSRKLGLGVIWLTCFETYYTIPKQAVEILHFDGRH